MAHLLEIERWNLISTSTGASSADPESYSKPKITPISPTPDALKVIHDRSKIEIANLNNIAQYAINSRDREQAALEHEGIPFHNRAFPHQLPHRMQAAAMRFYYGVIAHSDGKIAKSHSAQIKELKDALDISGMNETDTAAINAFTDVLSKLEAQANVPIFRRVLDRIRSYHLPRRQALEEQVQTEQTPSTLEDSAPININNSAVERVHQFYEDLGLSTKRVE